MIAVLVLGLAALADSQFAPAAGAGPTKARELFAPAAAPGFPAAPPAPFKTAPAPVNFAPITSQFTPSFGKSNIGVVQRVHQSDDNGQFVSSYTATDGSSFQETGSLQPTNDHLDNVVVKKGSYRYITPEGVPVEVTYTADQYGYHPQGAAIPVSPPSHTPSFT